MNTAQDKKHVDHNGYWYIENNPISRTGVFPYLGKQISDELEPDKVYQVYRPAEELFSPEAMASFKLMPLVDDHTMLGKDYTPAEQKGIEGVLGEKIERSGDMLTADIKIYSESLKDEIRHGKKELSLGYFCDYDLTPGTYKGQHYDAVQRNLRGNHIALVDKGRMGREVRVMDSADKSESRHVYDSMDIIGIDEEEKWVYLHPNGNGSKGTPVKLDDDDKIIGGLGGKHNGQTLGELSEGKSDTKNKKSSQKPLTEKELETKLFIMPEEESVKLGTVIEKSVKDKNVPNSKTFYLGEMPPVLKFLKVKGNRLITSKKIMIKAMGKDGRSKKEQHRVREADLKKIPKLLKNPLAVIKSSPDSTNPNALVVLLNLKATNGDPVIGIFDLNDDREGGYLFMTSCYDKQGFGDFVNTALSQHRVLYRETEETLTDFQVQFQSISVKVSKNSIPDKKAVVKHFMEKSNKKAKDSREKQPLDDLLSKLNDCLREFNEELEDLNNGSDEAAVNKENTMDRREVIREIMAIAAKDPGEFKGGEEEKIETISALAEKLAYSKGKEEQPDADEITTANPGETETETETITKTESPENEEEKKQDAAKCDAAQQPMQAAKLEIRAVPAEGTDEAIITKAINRMHEMAELKARLTPYIGEFNSSKMHTAADMADYALKKLGKKAKGDKVTFLEGCLSEMKQERQLYGMASDGMAADEMETDTLDEILKGVK